MGGFLCSCVNVASKRRRCGEFLKVPGTWALTKIGHPKVDILELGPQYLLVHIAYDRTPSSPVHNSNYTDKRSVRSGLFLEMIANQALEPRP